MDGLVEFRSDYHEAIIFDDMSFSHMPRTAQIHLLDWDDDRRIHVRYTTVVIPKYTKKIFTSNMLDLFDLNDSAISRRVEIVNVFNKLF